MTTPTVAFQMKRRFAVDIQRLWHLLTDPQAREIWGAPSDDDSLILEQADFREGGQDRHRCGPADNPEYTVDTHWYHIDAPQIACFTETVTAGGVRFGVSLVSYNLSGTGASSELIVDVAVASLTGEDMQADFQAGWASGLSRLEALIANGRLK